ncbi:MAG: nucleotidyltransferase family protein [Deltaproteobacteria bacterium]|nr:nucleotidyltransferase family protein [Deltaproteobacteria bacterium]
MKEQVQKVGRPLKGDRKRVRVSFTLHPSQAEWLKRQASLKHHSKSEILEKIISEVAGQLKEERPILRIYVPTKKVEAFCVKYHVKKLSLFGSVLREDFRSDSDIDVLVEFQEGYTPSLFEFVPMESELGKIFEGRKVDLRTLSELGKYFREKVAQEAQTIYAQKQFS